MRHKPRLRNAVNHHLDCAIEYWDGQYFQPSDIQVNIDARNRGREPSLYFAMSAAYDDPIASLPTNIIREVATGHIWQILVTKIASHRGEPYQTIYNIIRVPYLATIMKNVEPPESSSGLNYDTTPDETPETIAETYVLIDIGLFVSTPKPATKSTMTNIYECWIDGKLPNISREYWLVLEDGREFTIQTANRLDNSYMCNLTLRSQGNG